MSEKRNYKEIGGKKGKVKVKGNEKGRKYKIVLT